MKRRLAMCEKTQRDTTNFLVLNMSAKLNTQQNLRELARLTFLNLMNANGVMAKTIIRNYKQKETNEKKTNQESKEEVIKIC
jgi:PHP family Zn ribbon phosphoesterase